MPHFSYQGKRVYYREKGSGEVLIILPGNTASSALHDGEIDYFCKNYRVICPDYLGYGKSERIDSFPTDFWWSNAHVVLGLIRNLQVDSIIAVGTSGGAIIALNMAIIAPDLVKAVVADGFVGEFWSLEWAQAIAKKRNTKTRFQRSFWQAAHGEDWEKVVQEDSLMLVEAARKGESAFKKRLKEITCPVLFTGSLSDDLIPDIERGMCRVARQISCSKVVFYPDGAHPLMWSRAVEFRKEVRSFLNNLVIYN